MIKIGIGPDPRPSHGLVIVQFKKSSSNGESKETTWAKPLGDSLYEIKRPLHFITGYNVEDVVKAVNFSGDTAPTVIEVIKQSKYKTLHVLFSKESSVSDRQKVLDELSKRNITYEQPLDRFYTLIVPPQGNYQNICDYLSPFSLTRLLIYEPEVDIKLLLRNWTLESHNI